jgi:hypothetical protein
MTRNETVIAAVTVKLAQMAESVDYGTITVQLQIRAGKAAMGRVIQEVTIQPQDGGDSGASVG